MRLAKLVVLLAALPFAWTCNCGETPPAPGGGLDVGASTTDDGGSSSPVDASSTPIADGGICTLLPNGATCGGDAECCSGACDPGTHLCVTGAGVCVPLGGECQSNVECCGGKKCESDGAGVKRCIDVGFCKPSGETCAKASECCSLSCNGTCQGTGPLCAPSGSVCASDLECCSNDCAGTCVPASSGCATMGEGCATEGYDANCCSKYCVRFATGAGSELRCAPSSTCSARGEICSEASDCCSGACLNGTCPTQAQLGQKLFVGEPCRSDSECASYACASTIPGGPRTCQYLGGCRPAEEICTEDWQCCGYLELSANRDQCQTALPMPGTCGPVAGVPGLSRCALQPTDKEVGEICNSGGNVVHNCCGGTAACKPTITGVSRCLYGGGFTPDGGCTANGEPCAIADQCCSLVCAPASTPDGGIQLQCSGCIATGGACTTHSDCCGFSCTDSVCDGVPPGPDGGVVDVDGGTEAPDASAQCRPLGATCTDSAECCSTYCSAADGGAGNCWSILN